MYKLIAVDLDRTLLTNQKEITNRTIEVIKRLKKDGIYFVFATGRPTQGINRYIDLLKVEGMNDYACVYNGAIVLDISNNKVLYERILKGKDAHLLAHIANELDSNMHTHTRNVCITPNMTKYSARQKTVNDVPVIEQSIFDIDENEDIIKFLMVDDKEKLDLTHSRINPILYEKYTVVRSTPYYLEFLNKEVNKWIGVKKIAEHLGIKDDEIICMGDAENDIEMIKNAAVGVAMGNAFESVKKHADYIAKTNEEDGVALAIEDIIYKKKNV